MVASQSNPLNIKQKLLVEPSSHYFRFNILGGDMCTLCGCLAASAQHRRVDG